MSEYRRRGESSPTYSRGRTLNGNERDRRCRSRSRSRSNEHPYRKNFYNENSRHGDKLHRTSDDGPLRLTNGDNDTLDRLVAVRIQELAALEVKKYVKSEDFTAMVELFKRRERERILAEIEHELAQEKASLLMEGRSKLALEYVASITQHPTAHHHSIPEAQLKNLTAAEQADAILLQNKLKMEEKQRLNYEAKQKEDAERLQQVLHRKQIEDLVERQRLEALMREQDLLEEVLQEPVNASEGTSTGAGLHVGEGEKNAGAGAAYR